MRNTGPAILERLIESHKTNLAPEAARYILALDFRSPDHRRMEKLSSKAQKGELTEDERAELEEYIRVADLLALLQSKARNSLKRAGLAS